MKKQPLGAVLEMLMFALTPHCVTSVADHPNIQFSEHVIRLENSTGSCRELPGSQSYSTLG